MGKLVRSELCRNATHRCLQGLYLRKMSCLIHIFPKTRTACLFFGMTVTTHLKPVPVFLKQITRGQRSCLSFVATEGTWHTFIMIHTVLVTKNSRTFWTRTRFALLKGFMPCKNQPIITVFINWSSTIFCCSVLFCQQYLMSHWSIKNLG